MVVKTSISISQKLRDFLIEKSISKSDSYEDVIWRLIGQKQISESDKKKLPSQYEKEINKPTKVRRR